MANPNRFVDFVDGIRGLIGSPPVRTADDYDNLAREYAGALLAGDEAEAARLAGILGKAKVRGEFALPNQSDLDTLADSFPADRSIIGGPVKTRGQSEALTMRPDVGGMRVSDDMTVQDAIDFQRALDQGTIVRGTLNTPGPGMGNPTDDLMSFFGNRAERNRAGLSPDLMPTRGDMSGQGIIDDVRTDQLLGIAAARAADDADAIEALSEAGPMYAMRTDSQVALPPRKPMTKGDMAKLAAGGTAAAIAAYALSQMGSEDEETPQETEADVITEAEPQVPQVGDPTGLAAEAEAEAAEMEELVSDVGSSDPLGDQQLPGRTMDADYLRQLMAGLKEREDALEDSPTDTADLVAESRPIPESTPVVVSQRAVYRQPRSRSYRRTSRRRRPNYGYSRAMNPSQRGYRRRRR